MLNSSSKNDPFGSSTYVVPDPTEHIPPVNPQVTIGDGIYAWDVVPGRWRVQAGKAGYDTVTTDPFDVPPPKLNLDITLMPAAGCNAPPVAKDDAYGAAAGALTVAAPGVLANDTDADGPASRRRWSQRPARPRQPRRQRLVHVRGQPWLRGHGFLHLQGQRRHGRVERGHGEDRSSRASPARRAGRPYRTTENRPFFIAGPGVLANDADRTDRSYRGRRTRTRHGFVLVFLNGAFVYPPAPRFVGTDTFTWPATVRSPRTRRRSRSRRESRLGG
jgi:hypothetical protein